jgi:DNA-binding NtrC family response regulator
MDRPEPPISKPALDELTSYDWLGNVRELQNVIERATILWRGGPFTFDLPIPMGSDQIQAQAKTGAICALSTRDELKRQERDTIVRAFQQTNGRVSGPRGAAEFARHETIYLGVPHHHVEDQSQDARLKATGAPMWEPMENMIQSETR